MNTKLERQLKFVKREAATRGNPCARLGGAFVLLRACFKDQGYRLKPKSPELAAAVYAARTLIGIIKLLDRHMDDHFQSVLERRELEKAINALTSSYTDQDIVIDAMNFADEAIKTMSEAFDEATFDPREAVEKFVDEFEEGEVVSRHDEAERKRELRMAEAELTIARLRLAAFLPRLAELMERVWMPLRKQITKAGLSPRNVMSRSDRRSRPKLNCACAATSVTQALWFCRF
jgi:hypothetical protein